MDLDAFFAALAGLIPSVVIIVSLTNHFNNKFASFNHKIEQLRSHLELAKVEARATEKLQDTLTKDLEEKLDYRVNAAMETIKHKAQRSEERDRILESKIEQIINWVEKQGFIRRGDSHGEGNSRQ